jgi:hypothetical protein
MENTILDQYIQRLQNIEPFNIYSVDAKGQVAPWYEVTGEIVKDVVLNENDLSIQVETVSAQIQHWGRMAAQCKRVWEIVERDFRIWKAEHHIALTTPPDSPDAWKKPTEKRIDAEMRTKPEYVTFYDESIRAEEAYNAANAVLDGFRAKRDMLKQYVYRHAENAAPRLAV